MNFNTQHEVINFNDYLPFNMFVSTINDINRHWHQSLEIVIVLDGTLITKTNFKTSTLHKGDIILFNVNELHELEGTHTSILTLQIKLSLFKNLPKEFITTKYDLNSTDNNVNKNYSYIKKLIAQMISNNISNQKYINIINESLLLHLIYELYANFHIASSSNLAYEDYDKLNNLLNLINNEYKNDLTLPYLASKVYLSEQYLSRLFRKNMGLTITDYIKEVRLRFAGEDLLNLNLTLQEVASNNGFPNARAFTTAFKEKYNVIPSIWRKEQLSREQKINLTSKNVKFNYLETSPDFLQDNLNKFILENSDNQVQNFSKIIPTNTLNVEIDTNHETPFIKTFKKFIGVSRAYDILRTDIKDALIDVQKTIGFEYIKMHGILDDDMMIYNEDSNGQTYYNFIYLDKVFDFILSINLKPLVQFSFMPSLLASEARKCIFRGKTNVSFPNSIRKWNHLIEAVLKHLIERYGEKTLGNWLFTLWNEPANPNTLFGMDDDKFKFLYKNTYETIRKVFPKAKIGGPAAFTAYKKDLEWLTMFLNFTWQVHMPLDFILIHYYDIELSTDFFNSPNYKPNSLWLVKDSDSFNKTLKRIHNTLKETSYNYVPLYITEWSFTTSHRDLLSDTAFKSAYIVKNIIDSFNNYTGLGYWLLHDLNEEQTLPNSLFHGGLGMYTLNGLKKSAYYAYYLLNMLGDKFICKGEKFLVTKKDDNYIIIVHNYSHYSNAYAKNIGVNMSYDNRYEVFPNKEKLNLCFTFGSLGGKYLIKKYTYSQKENLYDNYISANGDIPLDSEMIDYLNCKCRPTITSYIVNQKKLIIESELEPLAIELIIASPLK